MKKTISTLGIAVTLAVGGAIAADRTIDPYTDAGTKLEMIRQSSVEGSGSTKIELAKDRAAISLSKWDEGAKITIVPTGQYGRGSRALLTNRMEWKDTKEEVHAYPLDATEQMEDGGFEIEIYLKEQPATNVFDFVIEGANELDFFFQPPLTTDEMAAGSFRPENVKGSYAVYHKQKKNHVEGQINYSTGKAFHIFRPKAIDAKGSETWAELTYKEGVLSVIVSEQWLDSAVYPVVIDPTFGLTTIGATASLTASDFLGGSQSISPSSSGTVSSISYYANRETTNQNSKGALYLVAGVAKVAEGSQVSINSGTAQWWTSSGMSASVSAGTNYYVGFGFNAAVSPARVTYYYDTVASANRLSGSITYPTFPDPHTAVASTRLPSVYATYTEPPPSNVDTGDLILFE